MTKTVRDYTAKAVAIVNAGQAIKVRVKEANEDLARGYAAQREIIMNACLEVFRSMRSEVYDVAVEAKINETPASELYWSIPDLHVFKQKHADKILAVFPAMTEVVAAMLDLAALRAEVKAVEIVKFEKKEAGLEETIKASVLKSFEEWMKHRQGQFDWSKRIIEEFNKEVTKKEDVVVPGISVNHVHCQNYAGTQWVRIDWFQYGRRVPFQIIAAAAGVVTATKEK